MKKGIIGKKLGMTQIFDQKGNVIPVTLIEAGPCTGAGKTCSRWNNLYIGYNNIKNPLDSVLSDTCTDI